MAAKREKKQEEKKPARFLDPKSDVVFKKIFGQHPDLIKSFLNNLLPLPEGRLIETVTYLPAEQTPRIPGMKNTIVDVKCKDESGRIFIVEMQMTWSKSFMSRFLFGTSKAYVQQLGRGKTYDTLCPVYGLALVNETFEEETDDWFHHYRLTNVKDLDKILEGMEMIFLELPKFNPKTFEDRKVGVLWMRFLRETDSLKGIPEAFKTSPEVIKAMELAQESAYTPAELAAYDEYLDAVRVAQTIRNDADARVREAQKAREESEAKLEEEIKKNEEERRGREEERKKNEENMEEERKNNEEERKNMACKMLAKGTSIEDVCDITGLPVEVVQSLLP
jgi:predicted transposase/invertase (TIGR01784 family)